MSENPTKRWKKVKIFDTYDEAVGLRDKLLIEDETNKLEVKIRRCGSEGIQFKVKTWHPPTPSKKKEKKNG